MISKIFSASKSSFLFCVEALEEDVRLQFGEYDFLLFAIHPSFPIESINHIIKRVFQTDNFVAFHAINAFQDDRVVEEAVTVCTFKFQNRGKISTYSMEDITNFEKDDSVSEVANYFNQNSDKFHIILTGFCEGKVDYFIDAVSQQLRYSPINNIAGGVSSGTLEDDVMTTFQFINNKIIKNGFIVLSFENVEAKVGASLGFQPYGITYEITKAEGTRLYSVDDGKSFSYMMQKMLNNLEERDSRHLWHIPLHILNDKDGYTAMLRTVKSLANEYVELFAHVEEGEHFKLSFATYVSLLQEDEKVAKKLIQVIREPEVAFNFSCVARQYILEEQQQKEVEIYTKNFNTHLFGFFTFGEIGPDTRSKTLQLYNETSFAIIMREK